MDGRRQSTCGISAKLWTTVSRIVHVNIITRNEPKGEHRLLGPAGRQRCTHSQEGEQAKRWRPLYSPRSTMGKGDAPSRSDSPTPSRSQSEKKPKPLPAWNNKAPWYVIDPRTSRYIGKWDVFTSVALIFVAFITPFEVALLEPTFDTLFIMNRVVDLIFGIDMVFSFLTVYSVRDVYITDPCKIACHYLRTWCVAGCP